MFAVDFYKFDFMTFGTDIRMRVLLISSIDLILPMIIFAITFVFNRFIVPEVHDRRIQSNLSATTHMQFSIFVLL